ncbi:MAG: PIG-L deacetylase family protein [Jatrophihabitantaceae bacterium]
MPDRSEEPRHVLVVVAHPDDESFGCGSVIADAVARGHRVQVCCATLGEEGELSPGFDLAGRTLAETRHDELRAAAAVLGAEVVEPLGLRDSGWDGSPPDGSLYALDAHELAARLTDVLLAHRPDVVITLAGDDGHRDHGRLADAVTAAFGQAAFEAARLYLWCLPNDLMKRWAAEMASLRPDTAHLALEIAELGTSPDDITTVLDTSAHLATRWRAIAAHASQTSPYDGLSPELAEAFLSTDHLIRLA